MKTKKSNKLAIIIVLSVIIALAALFSFVPLKFGTTKYTGVWGAINVSSDLYGGMYGEYDIKGEASRADITSSMAKIKSVLQKEGYQSCNVYSIDGQKIRVEIGYPQRGANSFSNDAYEMLNNVSVGSFQFRSSNSSNADTEVVVVNGAQHVKKMSIADYNGTTYLTVEFNKAGEAKFKELCNANTNGTVYVYMGDNFQTSFTASNISSYSQVQLSVTDYESAHDFYLKAMLGSISVDLNNQTKVINTMTSGLGLGYREGASVLLWVLVALTIAVLGFGLGYIALKYKMAAVLLLPILVLDAIITLWIFAGIKSVEFSFTSLISLMLGAAIIYSGTLALFGRISEEFRQGKTIAASLEAGIKRARPAALVVNAALLVFGVILFLFIGGEMGTASLIVAIACGLNVLTNVLMLPWFATIFNQTNKRGGLPFGLKNAEEVQHD